MLHGEGEALIARSPEEILELVLDLEQYRKADTKFSRILGVDRSGLTGTARYSAKLRGIPTPADTQSFTLAADYSTLRFVSTDKFWPNVMARFEGRFECRAEDGGTRVRHVEQLTFSRAVGWIADPAFGTWWAREVRDEVGRLKELLEADSSGADQR